MFFQSERRNEELCGGGFGTWNGGGGVGRGKFLGDAGDGRHVGCLWRGVSIMEWKRRWYGWFREYDVTDNGKSVRGTKGVKSSE